MQIGGDIAERNRLHFHRLLSLPPCFSLWSHLQPSAALPVALYRNRKSLPIEIVLQNPPGIPLPETGSAHLEPCQILVHELHCNRPLANRRSYPLHRSVSHVSGDENH